jgi:naphthoate synthase/2-ketocyclohexanecarboxyl-CoA hydrolase
LLSRLVGERKAREMVYTCRTYSAQEALAMGLVNEVVPDAELDHAVARMCDEILDKSPQSIRIAKIALNAGSDQEFYSSFFPAAELLSSVVGNEENLEGVRAFLEKRPTDFRKYRR